jgi:ParB family chromosome partitioning protein
MAKKNALGRGLGALIESHENDLVKPSVRNVTNSTEIFLSSIEANPFNPRTEFDEDALAELANSIRELGVIQPITVRKVEENKFQIIAGERRFRASKIAGLKKIPAFIRLADDNELLELALVENIQREDLSPIEVGLSYQRLMEECKLTQERLSERVGKKRATISNYVRLLKLPAEIQSGLSQKDLSMGHARALVNIESERDKIKVYNRIVSEELSVRQTEEIVRKLSEQKYNEDKKPTVNDTSNEYEELQKKLADRFQTKVKFNKTNAGKGKIVIPFNSEDDLQRIISIFDEIN